MLTEVALVEVSDPFCAEPDGGADTILYWYNGVVADLGEPGLTRYEVPDPPPWNMYDPEAELWDTTPPLRILLHQLAARAALTAGVTATGLLYRHQQLLDFMNRKDRADGCEKQADGDVGGSTEDVGVGSAAAVGGGGAVSGGSEDGDAVGEPSAR